MAGFIEAPGFEDGDNVVVGSAEAIESDARKAPTCAGKTGAVCPCGGFTTRNIEQYPELPPGVQAVVAEAVGRQK